MATCIGFVRSHFSKNSWAPCTRPAVRRGQLCAEHRDGLDGALMGILDFRKIVDPNQEREKIHRQQRRNNSSSRRPPAWDTCNAAAAKMMPERLEPDPARACPAPNLRNQDVLHGPQRQL